MRINLPDSIQIKEWATDGNNILMHTNNPNGMFATVSLDSLVVNNIFGKKGKGAGEFIMPHVLGNKDNGLIIIDNGNQKIYRIDDSKLTEIGETNESALLNQPHFLKKGIIGFQELSPKQLMLNKFYLNDNKVETISTFPENGETENSDLFDFVWDASEGKIVIAHLYTDKFSIMNNEHYVTNIVGDNKYSQDRMVYTDIVCGDFIYLLCQTNVNIEDFSGYSVIEQYDYNGSPIAKFVYDGIIDKIILDQGRNRIFFTSTVDEDLHYFDILTI